LIALPGAINALRGVSWLRMVGARNTDHATSLFISLASLAIHHQFQT
jgi:hypothetical protein